jgi:undecaprenyl diphosphate synthase
VAIIMDGNGRWAMQRGLPRSEGHKAGVEAARAIVRRNRELLIPNLTMYTFSKENWARPKEEVNFLFDLLAGFLRREMDELMKRDIRLNVLGDIEGIPFATRKVLEKAMRKSESNQSMTLNLALNYGGRDEILHACREIVRSGVTADRIDEQLFRSHLFTGDQPDPDLIIRTSGELRLSNYLIFQAAYAEFYFTETLWPDFDPDAFDAALADFAARERRFGATRANGSPSD